MQFVEGASVQTSKKTIDLRDKDFSQLKFAQKKSVNPQELFFLRRVEAQTLPNTTAPISRMHPFSIIAVAFEPMIQF